MAEKKTGKGKKNEKIGLIDPFYKKYVSGIIKTLGSDEYYKYFMQVVKSGKNEYQFSNRQVEKTVDETWVSAVEAVIKPMQEIINNPRNFIIREQIIVNVALAKKVEAETIRHLCSHGDMIDEVHGDSVRPNRLLEVTKEDSINTYENRFVYTLLEMAWEFVDMRYEAIFASMGEEFGSHLNIKSDSFGYLETVKAEMDIKIQQNEEQLSADAKSEDIFSRISRVHRNLAAFRSTSFAKQMSKYGKIKPPVVKTNAIKKNPNFKACHKLWDFIIAYNDVGYKIEVREQSTELDDAFIKDMYNSILYNYMILKHHLDSEKDRLIDYSKPVKKKESTPKFIKQIIEEVVEDRNLPDVEVKKVLIEEVTKADLMQLEEEERRRLVAEKEKEMLARKKEEERQRKIEEAIKRAEEERLEKERQKEEKRLERQRRAEALAAEREAFRKAEETEAFLTGLTAALELEEKNRVKYVEKRAEEKRQAAIRAEKEEKERLAAEKKEAARLAALEKAEQDRIKAERKAEEDRKAAELAEAQKKADEARIISEQAEAERLIAEKRDEIEKLEAEKNKVAEAAAAKEAEAAAAEEKLNEQKAAAEKQAKEAEEKLNAKKAEAEKLVKEAEEAAQKIISETESIKAEAENITAEAQRQLEKSRADKESAEKNAVEAEKTAKEHEEARISAEKAANKAREKAEAEKLAKEAADAEAVIAAKKAEEARLEAERVSAESSNELDRAKNELEEARRRAEVIRQEARIAGLEKAAALKAAAEKAAGIQNRRVDEENGDRPNKKQKKADKLKEKRDRKRAMEAEQREKQLQRTAEAKENRMREQEALMAAARDVKKGRK